MESGGVPLSENTAVGVTDGAAGRRHPAGAAGLSPGLPTPMNREPHADRDFVRGVPEPADGCIFLERPRCQKSP